jgi:predicted RecB family nuclease
MIITAQALRHLLECDRRIWLDQHGNPAERADVTTVQVIAGIEHEKSVQSAMFGPVNTIPAASWSEMVEVTRDLMNQGVEGIQGAAFERVFPFAEPLILRGRVDWLRRTSQPSRLGRWSYEPIEIKLHRELTPADRIQLDLYIALLTDLQGVEPSGWFWLGKDTDGQPLEIIEHSYNENRLLNAIDRASNLLRAQTAPPVLIATHCKTCNWYASCTRVASENLDLSLVQGLRSETRKVLHRAGITTLHHIASLQPDELKRFKGIKSTAPGIHAHARAYLEGRPIWYNPLPGRCQSSGIMFDLETDPESGQPWSLGFSDGEGDTQIILVASKRAPASFMLGDITITLVRDVDEAWFTFAEAVGDRELIYHWSGYDAGVLRKTAPPEVILELGGRMYDLLQTFNQTVKLPVKSSSLKVVGAYLGYAWEAYEDWWQAYQDYQSWLRYGDEAILTKACMYQRDDVVALAKVWRWMQDNAVR